MICCSAGRCIDVKCFFVFRAIRSVCLWPAELSCIFNTVDFLSVFYVIHKHVLNKDSISVSTIGALCSKPVLSHATHCSSALQRSYFFWWISMNFIVDSYHSDTDIPHSPYSPRSQHQLTTSSERFKPKQLCNFSRLTSNTHGGCLDKQSRYKSGSSPRGAWRVEAPHMECYPPAPNYLIYTFL